MRYRAITCNVARLGVTSGCEVAPWFAPKLAPNRGMGAVAGNSSYSVHRATVQVSGRAPRKREARGQVADFDTRLHRGSREFDRTPGRLGANPSIFRCRV